MKVKLDNTCGNMIFVTLSSGVTCELSPQVCPVIVSKTEVESNHDLKKLIDRRMISVVDIKDSEKKDNKSDSKMNDRVGKGNKKRRRPLKERTKDTDSKSSDKDKKNT